MFPEHELKVAYPLGGEHVCLVWYERNEGNHVIVAKSEAAASVAFRRVLKAHGSVEVKSYEALTIVAPPDSVKDAHAKEMLDREQNVFWDVYMHMALDYEKRHGKLPGIFVPCPAAATDEHHYDCSCRGCRLELATGDRRSEFLKRRGAYLKRHPRQPDARFFSSKALAPKADAPLFAATAQFGHHCTGVAMDEEADTSLSPVLFFYQDARALPRGHLQAMVDVEMKAEKATKRRRDTEWEARKRQRNIDDDKEVEEMFG